MGEAKRRKQKLKAEYGQPLGLTNEARRDLIKNNLESLLSTHYQEIGYTDWLDRPCSPKVRLSLKSSNNEPNFDQMLDVLVQHWQDTFNSEFPRSALAQAVKSIKGDQPIFLTAFSTNQLNHSRQMRPVVPLPEARKYFRRLLDDRQINLSTHYILLTDVLSVLADKKASPLVKQLLLAEFNDVILDATTEQVDWMVHNTSDDGWLNLTEEVLFQGGNRALLGLLTLLITLPWEMKLRTLMRSTV
jgi:hypothetical protein